MLFPTRIYKQKYNRDMIDQYVRRFYTRKSIAEMAERLGVKITYIKHRIHAMNIAPYKEDKIPVVNKRPYKDYSTYNYAEHFDKAIGHIKFVYSDPDVPFSEWVGYDEIEEQIIALLRESNVMAFRCDQRKIQCKQARKDIFLW